MNNNYRFTLEKYHGPASRYTCPSCGQRRRFTRYIDTQTGTHLAERVGRCDRLDHCGYHYTPRQYFDDNKLLAAPEVDRRVRQPRTENMLICDTNQGQHQPPHSAPSSLDPRPPSLLPQQAVIDSMDDLRHNHLLTYLRGRFTEAQVDRLVVDYCIGTSTHWPGATVFWQIDAQHRIRTGKVMLYHPDTGRRVKEPAARISWAHSLMGIRDYRLEQCLYGEHLLTIRPERFVAIVESEKTALLASVLMPRYLWLATGGKEGLSAQRLEPLRGRRLMLYPDAGAYDLWSRRARELAFTPRIEVSDLLERLSRAGRDIGDYF